MHVIRLPRAVAGLAILLPFCALAQVPATNVPQPTLHAMVESAWQRSPLARTLAARQDETAAGKELAGSWLASAPSVGLSQRSDRWTDQRDRRESEISLSASVWLPGQRARRSDLADAGGAELDAQSHQLRLEIAGQVRDRLWEVASAREVAAEKEDHWQHLQELAQDVERRVAAGDLPRSDGLMAQQEVISAQMALSSARRDARTALARFALLTGMQTAPVPEIEPLPPTEAAVPVRLQAAQAAERRARAAVAAATAQPTSAPTIALSMRRERDGLLAPSDRSIGVSLQIPLVGKMRNRPAETAAATQLGAASAELAMTQALVDADIELARSRLRDAEEGVALAETRAESILEHTRLFQQAFALGERSLAELLRSRVQSHEAQIALRQQRNALGRAHADFNQALGIIP